MRRISRRCRRRGSRFSTVFSSASAASTSPAAMIETIYRPSPHASVTTNATYDHVTVKNFTVGINAPVNGVNTIIAGRFDNV